MYKREVPILGDDGAACIVRLHEILGVAVGRLARLRRTQGAGYRRSAHGRCRQQAVLVGWRTRGRKHGAGRKGGIGARVAIDIQRTAVVVGQVGHYPAVLYIVDRDKAIH